MIYFARIGCFILTINLFSNALNSQDLTFDINYASNEVLVGEDSVGVFYGSIINTSSENINIRILRTENVTNLGWTSSICIGSLCYSNWVDSVNVNIVSEDSADFSIYVWTNGEGNDSLSFTFYDLNTPDENIDLKLFASTHLLISSFDLGNNSIDNPRINVFPNPFNSSLKIEYTLNNAQTPISGDDLTPVLTVDLWEHAYYIDYRNARPKYLENFWALVNWEFASSNFA